MERRTIQMESMHIREQEDGKRRLEGYFAVFDQPYEVVPGWVETVAPGAFDRALSSGQDVKVLWNHDSNLVLGSTSNHTAFLRADEKGLYGGTEINENDQDAKNAYARVDRRDVTGCSFGFDISRIEESWDEDGTYRTRILEAYPLYEVSPCTFPAYTQTSIMSRAQQQLDAAKEKLESARQKKREQWRTTMLARLKGENYGTQNLDAETKH
jgi:uncharacterized protein